MITQATKLIFIIIAAIVFIPSTGLAQEKLESSKGTLDYLSIFYSDFTTQDDLVYIYDFYNEGLVNTKYMYQMDVLDYEIESISNKSISEQYEPSDVETLISTKERINR
jgi:hypothetical protein